MNATANAVSKKDNSFPAILEKFKGEIERALPKHLNADRMVRIALTEFRKNPQLEKCDPRSVFASIIVASQLGIEPGIMGQGYLIPYKNECQFVPGWQGIADLVARAGRASVWTGAVFDGDEFDYALGDRPFITHRPGGEDDVNKMLFVYAVGRIKGAEWPVIEVWRTEKVERHLKQFNKVGDRHYAFKHFEMYARKVVLLQVIKYMPKSVEVQTAADLDYAAQKGKQGIDIKDAIDGTWIPSQDEEESENAGDGGARAESMKDRMRAQSSQQQLSPPSENDLQQLLTNSLNMLANAQSAAAVDRAWKQINANYANAGVALPLDVEAKRNERLESIKQQI